MSDSILELQNLERRANYIDQQNRNPKQRITKIHSLEFLSRQNHTLIESRIRRLKQRILKGSQMQKKTQGLQVLKIPQSLRNQKEPQDPEVLYASDWLTIVATLAQMARKSPEACIIALGLGDPEQNIRPGLLWIVSPNGSTKLVNKKAFQDMFWSCQNRRNVRFIIGLLAMSSRGHISADHMLSYIYDIKQNEIEIFDPNGGLQMAENMNYDMYSQFMDNYFRMPLFNDISSRYFQNVLRIRKVHFPTEWCPVGIQELEEQDRVQSIEQKQQDFGGYCAAWSIWWLQERLRHPNVHRSQLLVNLTKQFTDQNINLKQWMLDFAKQLSRTKIRLMKTALRFGGRRSKEINHMIRIYSHAYTECRKARNLLYHMSKEQHQYSEQQRHHANNVCQQVHHVIEPILVEVTANLEPAVRQFSGGRIAVGYGRLYR